MQKSKYGAFYFTYLPRRYTAPNTQRNYWDFLPPDNEYFSDFAEEFGENQFHSNSNSLKKVRFSANATTMKENKELRQGEVLVDGGCDTTLVGSGCRVESTTSRTVTVL